MLALFSVIVVSGCISQGENFIEGNATIDDIDIEILESFPVQVNVIAKGNLPDSCSRIGMQIVGKGENTFFVELKTSRPADVACAQVITPFEEVISLDVIGLKAGNYTVNASGVIDTFELQIDNFQQDGNVGEFCQETSDCQTPVSFLIQSNCPFGSACVDGKCAVVCPITFHDPEVSVSHTSTCSTDTECDCSQREGRTIECRCADNRCVSVEAK